MRDIYNMSRGNSLASKQAQLNTIAIKGLSIKGLVVYNNWDLESLDLLNGLALGCCYQPSPEVLIVLTYT